MVGSEVLGWRGWGRTDPCMWGSPFFSLRAWDGGRFLWGRVDGGRMCEGGGEVRDRANPMLVGVGDRLFARGADEGRSSTRGELVRGGRVFFSFVFSVWCGVGAQRPDALLAPDVRALAGPLFIPAV